MVGESVEKSEQLMESLWGSLMVSRSDELMVVQSAVTLDCVLVGLKDCLTARTWGVLLESVWGHLLVLKLDYWLVLPRVYLRHKVLGHTSFQSTHSIRGYCKKCCCCDPHNGHSLVVHPSHSVNTARHADTRREAPQSMKELELWLVMMSNIEGSVLGRTTQTPTNNSKHHCV